MEETGHVWAAVALFSEACFSLAPCQLSLAPSQTETQFQPSFTCSGHRAGIKGCYTQLYWHCSQAVQPRGHVGADI